MTLTTPCSVTFVYLFVIMMMNCLCSSSVSPSLLLLLVIHLWKPSHLVSFPPQLLSYHVCALQHVWLCVQYMILCFLLQTAPLGDVVAEVGFIVVLFVIVCTIVAKCKHRKILLLRITLLLLAAALFTVIVFHSSHWPHLLETGSLTEQVCFEPHSWLYKFFG